MRTAEWLKTPEAQAMLARSQAHLRGRIAKVIYKRLPMGDGWPKMYEREYALRVYRKAVEIAEALQGEFRFRLGVPGSPVAGTVSFKTEPEGYEVNMRQAQTKVQMVRSDLNIIKGALHHAKTDLLERRTRPVRLYYLDMAIKLIQQAITKQRRTAAMLARARAKDRRCKTCDCPLPCGCDWPVR